MKVRKVALVFSSFTVGWLGVFLLWRLIASLWASPEAELTLVSWNVENLLFQEETQEGLSSQNKQTLERMARIATVLEAFSPQPNLLLFQEILDFPTIQLLQQRFLSHHYQHLQYFPGAPHGMGALSKFPFEASYHPLPHFPRGVAQLVFSLQGERFMVFLAHWRSMRAGLEESEPTRLAAAQVIKALIQEEKASFPETFILVVGDLNIAYTEVVFSDPFEQALIYYEDLDSDLFLDFFQQEGGLPVFRSLESIFDVSDTQAFPYMLWDSIVATQEKGSFFFRGEFLFLDRALIDGRLLQAGESAWQLHTVCIFTGDSVANSEGKPSRAALYFGVSDHFPIFAHFSPQVVQRQYVCPAEVAS